MAKLIDDSMKHVEWCLDNSMSHVEWNSRESKSLLLREIRKKILDYAFVAMTESQVTDEVYKEVK